MKKGKISKNLEGAITPLPCSPLQRPWVIMRHLLFWDLAENNIFIACYGISSINCLSQAPEIIVWSCHTKLYTPQKNEIMKGKIYVFRTSFWLKITFKLLNSHLKLHLRILKLFMIICYHWKSRYFFVRANRLWSFSEKEIKCKDL